MNTQYFIILFLGISPGELLIVLFVILILFGPRKIPEIARTLGRGLNELKKAQSDINSEIKTYTDDIEKEAGSIKSAVENTIDDNSLDPLDDVDKTNNKDHKDKDMPSDDGDTNENKSDDDADGDDLPFPYNKNLKA